MKNKLTVTISDLAINVNTDYDQEYVDTLAEHDTERLDTVLKASRYSSKLDAALLVLLDLFDENERCEAENAQLKKELESLRLDLEIQKIENEKLTEAEEAAASDENPA